MEKKAIIFFVVCIVVFGSTIFGQELQELPELKVISNYKERLENRIYATGNVEIHYKNIKLFADKIELDTETKDVLAEGNVVIQLPEEVMSCESIQINLDSSKGELKKVFGMVQPSISYEAESIEREDAFLYRFKKAKITSCTQTNARWNFSSSKVTFKKDEYMDMWNTVLTIKKIPVFYFPYIRYPLDRERATGFLTPQLGYSGRKGLIYSQSFYWAIRRNMDATFDFNHYSTRGSGGGMEFRYLYPRGTGGDLKLYYFIFKKNKEIETPDNAYLIRLHHNQPLPFGFGLVADIDTQSSFDFLREFDNNFKRALISNRSSQIFILRSWSYFNFNMRMGRFETYFKEIDSAVINRTMPNINFNSSKIKLFSPLYLSFQSSFKAWEYGWERQYQKGTQSHSQELNFNPELSMPFTAIPWLTIDSAVSASFNYNFQSYALNSKSKIVNEPLLAHNYTFRTRFIGPAFNKIYFDGQGNPKLKHIIEPSFSFRYESPVASFDRIITPRFFSRNHFIRYGLTNRFLVKEENMAREIFVLGAEQRYFLVPDEESPMQQFRVNGEVPKFSDITGYLRFYPKPKYSLDFSAGFNPYFIIFSHLRLGANLGSPEDTLFVRVNWFKSFNPYYEDRLSNRHQVNCFTGIKIPRLSLEARAEIDFNIEEMEMLYSAFALVHTYQCIDFRVDFRVFYFREKPETQFRITFGLGNIGKTTDFLGGIGF